MKKLEKYINRIVILALAGMMFSCIKENGAITADEANVTLVLTRNGNLTDNSLRPEKDEVIHTLRIIVVQSGEIIVNEKLEDLASDDIVIRRKIWGLHEGKASFYAIANEESLGLNDRSYNQDEQLFPREISDLRRQFFPLSNLSEKGIPILGATEVNIQSGKNNMPQIELTYAVAKILFDFDNQSGSDIIINSINFGKFFADRTFFFPGENTVPTGTEYAVKPIVKTFTIKQGTADNIVTACYFYETAAGNRNFTVSFTPQDNKFSFLTKKQTFLSGLNEIKRGQAVKVKATITARGITFSDFTIEEWRTAESDGNINIQ